MVKISNLPADTSIDGSDLVSFVDTSEGTTERITFTQLADSIPAGTITTAKLADASVTNAKLSLSPQAAAVATSQTTTSTSYTDLSTAGPAVTITVPSSGMIWLSFGSRIANSVSGAVSRICLDVSGANTVATSDTSIYAISYQASGNDFGHVHKGFLVTGLTPGSTTFTMKYRATANTATYRDRYISAEQR